VSVPADRGRPYLIRRERGLPWQWLLTASLAILAALAWSLPALVGAPPAASLASLPPPGAGQPSTGPVPAPAAVTPAAPAPPAPAPPAPADFARIEPAEASALIRQGSVVVIDARAATAFAEARIPGAVNVTPVQAAAWGRSADLTRPILVYCD